MLALFGVLVITPRLCQFFVDFAVVAGFFFALFEEAL